MDDFGPNSDSVSLSNHTLTSLPEGIDRPAYDRAQLTPGIVHIGVGNFHRAHQAWYLHRLMQTGAAQDWAIIGAGVRPYDAEMRRKLLAQDCLSTLVELDPAGASAEIIGSMIDYLPIEHGNAPLITALSDPTIRIVSLTVTEGGYYTHPVSGNLDKSHPDIAHDATHPDHPGTAFGAIVAGLRARRDRGLLPFTVVSCDNLRGNGDIARQAVVSLARIGDPALADWIQENAAFPNSMVDCIVPATGPHEIALTRKLGIEDAAPVSHENFRQWVIQDTFCAGRPALEQAGVVFSDQVHAYESMKIRILNAGHQILANIGDLLGLQTISECMAHPTIHAFFHWVQRREILPIVDAVPDMPPEEYLDLIERRFANPTVVDTVRRVAFDGSSRHPGFVVPILRDRLAAGLSIDGLALVEALWARMCFGVREDGSHIKPNDPLWSDLNAAARAARTHSLAWLDQRQFYGNLADHPDFAPAFDRWLTRIWADGVTPAVKSYISD